MREIYLLGRREDGEFHACAFRLNVRCIDCRYIHFPNIYRKAVSVLQNVKKSILFAGLDYTSFTLYAQELKLLFSQLFKTLEEDMRVWVPSSYYFLYSVARNDQTSLFEANWIVIASLSCSVQVISSPSTVIVRSPRWTLNHRFGSMSLPFFESVFFFF